MMSNDNTTQRDDREESPFRRSDAPTENVSGVPDNYVMIDLSTHKEPAEAEAPASVNAPANEKTPSPAEEPKKNDSTATVEIIGIRFKKGGKIYYFDPHGIKAPKGGYAIVETARGQEYGEIALENTFVSESEIIPPIRPVVRIATKADEEHYEENRKREQEAFRTCLEKIAAHKLDMKLVEAQYTFDNSKLLFYFTSAGRVDFRDLVKDLASVFRTRIELRQIGIRDEAKLIGGLGSCGRALCCAGFLSDFGQVSIKMAKEQNLSLNSTKISGTCGRLMCCLRFEYEAYLEEIRLTPPVDSIVKTPDGVGTVVETAPLRGMIKVRLSSEPDAVPCSYHRDTVTVFPKGKAPTEEDLAIRARQRDDFSEKLAAFESALATSENPPRRPLGDPLRTKDSRSEGHVIRKKDEKRPQGHAQKRSADGGDRPKTPVEDIANAKNRSHSQRHRGKPQNQGRRPHSTQKTQHRGSGGKSGSGGGNS